MTEKMKHFDVAVIGAGPAGIMAAIWAAKSSAKVALLEKNDQMGRKILATGNGRCNVTNKNIDISRYHGDNIDFAEDILNGFDTIEYFESIGVALKEEDSGRIFPVSDKASDIVNSLEKELRRLNVEIITEFTVKNLQPGQPWKISDGENQFIAADKLVLTTGGKAAHSLGSSGDGLFWAKNFGHTIVPIHAALVPIETKEPFVKDIMGIKLKTRAKLLADDKEIIGRDGDILFTHYGISGPAAMGLAREVDRLIAGGHNTEISVDICSEISYEDFDKKMSEQIVQDGKKSIKNVLADLIPKNLAPFILRLADINPDIKAAEISRKQRTEIISKIKDFRLTISKVRPLKEAQVMAGGVSMDEITKDLESKIVPNLYFAGEILDIDADSGGFNLQWAWASGKIVGEAVAKR